MNLEMEYVRNSEFYLNLEKKFKDDLRIIRVYIDEEKDKYYIDTFAAYELGLIDYRVASSNMDLGKKLFEITKEMLDDIRRVFGRRIEYIPIRTKNRSIPLTGYDYDEVLDNNKSGDYELDDNNLIGKDFENVYLEYQGNRIKDYEQFLSNQNLEDNIDSGFKI